MTLAVLVGVISLAGFFMLLQGLSDEKEFTQGEAIFLSVLDTVCFLVVEAITVAWFFKSLEELVNEEKGKDNA